MHIWINAKEIFEHIAQSFQHTRFQENANTATWSYLSKYNKYFKQNLWKYRPPSDPVRVNRESGIVWWHKHKSLAHKAVHVHISLKKIGIPRSSASKNPIISKWISSGRPANRRKHSTEQSGTTVLNQPEFNESNFTLHASTFLWSFAPSLWISHDQVLQLDQ